MTKPAADLSDADVFALSVIDSMLLQRGAAGRRYRDGVREAMLDAFRASDDEDEIMRGLSAAMREHAVVQ